MSKLAPNEYRLRGHVKFYNQIKGYGFIEPDTGEGDVFVHAETIKESGYNFVAVGARATCIAVRGSKGLSAVRVEFER